MNESYGVHPRYCTTQLAEYSSKERFGKTGVRFLGRDEIEELPARNVLEHKDVVGRSAKRMYVRHDRWVGYVLETVLNQQAL